jgi:S-adenosylmethionine:tRNA ribosyltransferase-isomerase
VHINLFDYHLPPELIAQYPAKKRDGSRLMVLDRHTGQIEIHPFSSIINFLHKGDALVLNNTRVFKARLFGHRKTGGKVEIFLIRPIPAETTVGKSTPRAWEGMAQPSKRLDEGEEIWFGEKLNLKLEKRIVEGRWEIRFPSSKVEKQIISKFGHTPLPLYVKRPDELGDSRRYQTVFARRDKAEAVAAPTAGLHFTKALLTRIKKKGVKVVELTLNVGPGTFKPVKVDDIELHKIDAEQAMLNAKAAAILNKIRKAGGRIIAVGTTSVRTLESAPIKKGDIQPFDEGVDLFIRPGHKFRVTDSLLTNFHLPRSSLLILVSALAGRENILKAYDEAIRNQMRFYSYGDAMLIV